MDTQSLQTFIVLANLRSFTKTADELFLAQSTVTNRIAELENEVGKRLFARNKRNVELTQEGMEFYQYAKRIVALTEEGIRAACALKRYERKWNVGATNTIYECYLYPIIRTYMEKNQDAAVKVTIAHSTELIQAIQDGRMDCIYTYLPLQKPGYLCEIYATDELVLVTSGMSKEYFEGIHKEELVHANYFYCNFALQEVGMFVRQLFPPHYPFVFEIDHSTKLIPYIIELQGVSFVPRKMAATYLETGELRTIPLLDFQAPKINCYQITKQEVQDGRKQ